MNKVKCRSVQSKWLEVNGRRLSSGPYLSGAIEAKEILARHRTQKLSDVTCDIYHAGRESRIWAESIDHGVRFMGSSDIFESDLSCLPLLSKKQIALNPKFTVRAGWTLITRSGTIGRMAYVRQNMDGMACSEHVMRIVPNEDVIRSGYLYAYLSGRFGVPIVISGTYGAIIQHVEPHHIASLPVPRLGPIEQDVHDLVQQSAELRTKASVELQAASRQYLAAASMDDIAPEYWHSSFEKTGFVSTFSLNSFRSMSYMPVNCNLEALIKERPKWKRLVDLTEPGTLSRGPRFKRADADRAFGVELVGQSECFSLCPQGRWISRKHLPNDRLLFPPDGTTMIAAQGCAGEHDLFGRAQFITGKRLASAYSEHFLRVIAKEDEIPRGALFAYLNTQIAYRIRKGYQIGSMQQDFHPEMIRNMPVPIIDRREAEAIDATVRAAYRKFDDALDAEDQARSLVERAIEEGGS